MLIIAQVLPTMIFFSATVSVLYHVGVMQVVIRKVAWVMQVTMGTTAGESLTAAANIFLSQVRMISCSSSAITFLQHAI